jgi:hypothetical protein
MSRFRQVAVFVVLVPALAPHIVTYEGDIFPEEVGWERRLAGTDGAERSLENGWFVQFVDLPDGSPGPFGNAEFYRRALADFGGEETFFVEWHVETDAPSSILDSSGTPVAVSAFGTAAANYHFTITDARVQVWRSNFLPILFVDIEPGVSHTYRLELCGQPLCGENQYAWHIDNRLGDSGVAEGPYPNDDSVLIWGAQHYEFDNTTRWDYIRFGRIPEDGSGDFDGDGVVTLDDFYFFHECLTNRRPGINGGPDQDAGPGCRFADFNADSSVDLADFAEFQVNFTAGE